MFLSITKGISHILLSGIFIAGGADAFLKPGYRVNKVASAGLPLPDLAVKVNGAAMVIAGIALALGFTPKVAAAILTGCLVPATLVGHTFWKESDAAVRKNQQAHFLKNLGLLGGLLIVLLEKDM